MICKKFKLMVECSVNRFYNIFYEEENMYFGVIFVIAFVLSIIVMVAYANKNYKKETLKTIGNNEKVWEITDKWAAKEEYILKSEEGNERLYQKGKNIISAPCYVQIEKLTDSINIKGWLFMNYGFASAKIAFDEPGFMGKAVRRKRMDAMLDLINELEAKTV